MSRHKAPTAVTIAPTEEKSGLAEWVERYWKAAAVVVLALTAWILYRAQSHRSTTAESQADWQKLLAVAQEEPSSGTLKGDPGDLESVARDLGAAPAGGWALYVAATSALETEDLDRAETLIAELRSKHPGHVVVAEPVPGPGGSASMPLVDHLEDRIAALKAFRQSHTRLFQNPALPEGAPRVRMLTSAGPFVVGLYTDMAPELAENFIKLSRDGYYNGTKFHGVVDGEFVQGGDPNSISGDPDTWGKGGPDGTFEFKDSALKHFAGTISAVPSPTEAGALSRSQFLITIKDSHSFDLSYAPFGKIVEGLDVVEKISSSPIAEGSFNRPKDPVTIDSVEVLE